MKKNIALTILVLSLTVGMAFTGKQKREIKRVPEKEYTVTLPLSKWQTMSAGIEYARSRIRSSNMPSNEFALIEDSVFNPLQVAMGQINQQIKADTTVAKPKTGKP